MNEWKNCFFCQNRRFELDVFLWKLKNELLNRIGTSEYHARSFILFCYIILIVCDIKYGIGRDFVVKKLL